jgi:malonyl-CoA decarboxylase
LFRRLNLAPGGTQRLVAMRADLLDMLRDEPEFSRIDSDFRHLLSSWFNRGFLVMRHIDWHTPAAVLEKIIAYEAVHEIDSWEELRRRVGTDDRRCFAFFHPSMPNEPLVFVEVALTRAVPGSIQALLAPERERIAPRQATTAVFYSISNCQDGLKGVSFGAFLIKQVAEDLVQALPKLETFVTLSPAPGLSLWLAAEAKRDPDLPAARAMALINSNDWRDDPKRAADLEALLVPLAAQYFIDAKRGDGQPPDPVARFHLGNGARLLDIHWLGDTSEKGLAQSFGIMVNYLYDLDKIEENHEAYATTGKVTASRKLRNLAATARKG